MLNENTEIRYWKISPGKGAENWEVCKDNNWISIGWYNDKDWRETEFGDLAVNPDKEKIFKVLRDDSDDDVNNRQISVWADIIKLFFEIKPGDKVIVYDKNLHINAMCEVIGKYEFVRYLYLFNWEEISGNEGGRLIDFLMKNYGIDWIKTAKITENDKDNTILVEDEENSLSLGLNNLETEAFIEIDDSRYDEFVVKTENGKRNIYKNIDYPHTMKVKWLQIFDPPLDIKDIKNTLDTKIWVPKTVVKMIKNDWDTIAKLTPPEEEKLPPTITRKLVEQTLHELGKKEASKSELLTKLKEIVGRDGGNFEDDETAWIDIQKLSDEK